MTNIERIKKFFEVRGATVRDHAGRYSVAIDDIKNKHFVYREWIKFFNDHKASMPGVEFYGSTPIYEGGSSFIEFKEVNKDNGSK